MSEEMAQEQLPTLEVKEEKNYKFGKALSTFLLVVGIIVLIIIKLNNPETKITIYLIIAGIMILIWAFFFWGLKWLTSWIDLKNKLDDKDKLPPITSELVLREKIKEIIENDYYQNHIRSWGRFVTHKRKDNIIYQFNISLVYELENDAGRNFGRDAYVFINAHYPKERWTILPIYLSSSSTVSKIIDNLSTSELDKPDIEETELFNPFTQTHSRTKKLTRNRPKEDKNKKEKELN